MSEKDTGGQAFPCAETQYSTSLPGMTLRDWFAGQALAGINATPGLNSTPEDRAKWSYQEADAMLAERSKP